MNTIIVTSNGTEYIRSDVALAMVAKAREEREMFAWAMEAVAKAREDALREAADEAGDYDSYIAILALIDGDKP